MLRPLLAGLAGLLAALLLPVAIMTDWSAAVVTDTDTYVDVVAPLAEDPVVLDAVTVRLESEAFKAIRKSAPQQLSEGARGDAVRALVHRVVERVVNGPEFPDAWVAANREAHEELVAVMEGTGAADEGGVNVKLATVLDSVLAVLAERGLVDREAAVNVDASFSVVSADDLEPYRSAYQRIDTMSWVLPALWLVLLVGCLVAARRRVRALVWLVVGSVLTLALAYGGLFVGRFVLVDRAGADGDLAGAVWDVLVESLEWAFVIAAVAGVLAAVVAAVVARVLRSRAA